MKGKLAGVELVWREEPTHFTIERPNVYRPENLRKDEKRNVFVYTDPMTSERLELGASISLSLGTMDGNVYRQLTQPIPVSRILEDDKHEILVKKLRAALKHPYKTIYFEDYVRHTAQKLFLEN